MDDLKKVLVDIPQEMRGKIKECIVTYETFHIGKTGFGETVVLPIVRIEFYETKQSTCA